MVASKCVSLFFRSLRYILAAVFIASGLLKALSLTATTQTIIHYLNLLGVSHSGLPLRLMAIAVCAGEIAAGILALSGKVFKLISPFYIIAMAAFTILTYLNLTSPYGNQESCGCFGELIHLNATETFIKNLILLAISIVLTICNPPIFVNKMIQLLHVLKLRFIS